MDPSLRSSGPPPALRDAIRASIAADLAPARSRGVRARAAIVATAAFAGCALAAVSFGKKPGAPLAHLVEDVVGALAIASAAGAIAGGLDPRSTSRRSARVKALIPLALGALWIGYLALMADGGASGPHAAATSCLMVSTIGGLVPAIAAMMVWRKADPFAPRRSGALIGAAAGLVGSAGVGITCVYREGGHLAIGHALALPLLAALCAVIGGKMLKP